MAVEHRTDTPTIWEAAVAAACAELGWELDDAQRRAYASAARSYLPAPEDDAAMRALLACYHADNELVRALRAAGDPLHDSAWAEWSARAIAIVRQQLARLGGDPPADEQDLAQQALEELARALPTYRYGSRFSTWAYSVVVRRVQRALRDSRAAKRAVRPDSLDARDLSDALVAESSVEELADAAALRELVLAVLIEQGDARLARIFELWAIDRQRLAEIGKQVHLSPSRACILIERARQILQRSPEIQAWVDKSE